jgi:hypothetical protein
MVGTLTTLLLPDHKMSLKAHEGTHPVVIDDACHDSLHKFGYQHACDWNATAL